jgi:AraC-like DNA-binding protein
MIVEKNDGRNDRSNVEHFTENAEALCRDVLLKYVEFSGKEAHVLGMEHFPEITEAGFVAVCLKGECELMLDHTVYHFKAGRICVGLTATAVRTLKKSRDFECAVLAANMEFLQEINIPSVSGLLIAIRTNPCMLLSDEDRIALLACFNYIRSVIEREEEHAYRTEITKRLLPVLCYEVAAIYQRYQPAKKQINVSKDSLFRHFVQLLSFKYQEERRVIYYAEELCVTPDSLSRAVKEVSGKTAAEWIDDFVVRNIKSLLTTTTLSIQQVSDRLHFPNPSFFTQYFKRATGQTPKAFRTMQGAKKQSQYELNL